MVQIATQQVGDRLTIVIELGRVTMRLDEVQGLRVGSLIPLDCLAAEPVDVFIDGRLAGRGEIVVVDNKFSVRIVELVAHVNTVV